MTPTLYPIAYAQAQMMNAGTFTLFHAWDIGDLFAIEYWRGADNNGACLRTLHEGRMVSITHYATPGAAIRTLRVGGYPIPGVPAMTDDERDHAAPYMRRTLQTGHVTHATYDREAMRVAEWAESQHRAREMEADRHDAPRIKLQGAIGGWQ